VPGFVELNERDSEPTLRDYLDLGYIEPQGHGAGYFGAYVKGVEIQTNAGEEVETQTETSDSELELEDLGYVGSATKLGYYQGDKFGIAARRAEHERRFLNIVNKVGRVCC
jgi:hypothetical protein